MNHRITKTLLALACAGTFAATAKAQLVTTYTQGDFLLGFRQVGSTNSVVVDLGPISSFTGTRTFAVNLGTTLSTQYGAGWATDANVFFSLASTASGNNTNYITSPGYFTGLNAGPARVWTRLTNSNSNVLQGKINSLGAELSNTTGQVEPKTDPDAYANFMPGGTTDASHATTANIAWGYFNPTSEGNFGQGAAGVELDLIQLAAGTGPGTDLGFFQLSGNGNTLTFTPGAVPEPSTYAAIALGALALAGFQFHRARKSSAQQRPA